MVTLLYHLTAIVVATAMAIWLWQRGREQVPLAYSLYGIILLQLCGGLLVGITQYTALSLSNTILTFFVIALQICCWAVLLRSWTYFQLTMVVGGVFMLILAVIDPASALYLLTWGLLPAFPLVTTITPLSP